MLAVSELMNYNFLDHARLPADGPIRDEFFEKVFLYGAGLKFIQAVREAVSWEAVDAVFQDPPQVTTLIFHPERYLSGERTTPTLDMPVKVGETLQTQAIRGEYEFGCCWPVRLSCDRNSTRSENATSPIPLAFCKPQMAAQSTAG
ncbi:MAG: hypothetical protein AAFY78_13965 [Cyanobacteria bacterium J06648_16]